MDADPGLGAFRNEPIFFNPKTLMEKNGDYRIHSKYSSDFCALHSGSIINIYGIFPPWNHNFRTILAGEVFNCCGMGHMMDMKQQALVWGYNGSMPGPTIEATEGDTIRVILKNELPEPTCIHWHGLEVPNGEDGACGVTEAVTMPGETHVYNFTLYQSGTFMYHTGFNVMKQDALGLGGLVVIHPKEEKNKPDREFAIMLQEARRDYRRIKTTLGVALGGKMPDL